MQDRRQKGTEMALAFVMFGIVVGTVAAGLALVTGAGIAAALLSYAGGGIAGLAGGVLLALYPRHGLLAALPRTE
jgi:hypothetical protein